MAIEMVNRKIRFLWNVGGGTQVITHSKEIETNSEQLLKNEQWFKIEANRFENFEYFLFEMKQKINSFIESQTLKRVFITMFSKILF